MDCLWDALRLVPATAAVLGAHGMLYRQDPGHKCVVNAFDRQLKEKLLAGSGLVAISLFDAASFFFTGRDIPCSIAIQAVGALGLVWVLFAEHKHSPKPYTLVSMMLAYEVVASAIEWLNTMSSHDSWIPVPQLYGSAVLAIKCGVLALHERSKWDNIVSKIRIRMDRDESYGFWSRCFSHSLFDQLNRNSDDGSISINIKRKVPNPLESVALRRFNKAWNEYHQSDKRLLWACAYSLKSEIVLAGLSVVLKSLFKLAIPFWIEAVTSHAEQRMAVPSVANINNPDNTLTRYTVLVLVGWLVSESCSRYVVKTVKLGVRSILSEAMLSKLQKRPSAAVVQHAKLALIADDVPELAEAASQAFAVLSSTIEAITLACFLGNRNRFIILILAAHAIILAVPLRIFHAPAAAAAAAAVAAQGERSNAMATVIMSMQGVTTLGHKTAMLDIIQRLRLDERETYRTARILRIWPQTIQVIMILFSDVYMFAFDLTAIYDSGIIPAFFKAFAQGLFFRYVTRTIMPTMNIMSSAKQAMDRVQTFLQLPAYEIDVRYITRQNTKSPAAVQFSNATIKAEAEANKILEDVDILFNRGSLTVITGEEGKSLLIQAAAGNCTIANGTVRLRDRSISYCGKEVWIESKSIKDNIIGDSDFNETWYWQVIRICCLEQDITRLPGNSNFIATKGTSRLDSGQLQRIALARSVYSRASILLLEDVLCYQDAASCASLLHSLFAPGGLLRHGTTVLIATDNWEPFINMGAQFVSVTDTGLVSWTTATQLFAREAILNPNPDHVKQLKRDQLAGSATQLMTQELLSRIRSEEIVATTSQSAGLGEYLEDATTQCVLAIALLGLAVVMEMSQLSLITGWFKAANSEPRPVFSTILCGVVGCVLWTVAAWKLTMRVVQPRSNAIFERLLGTIMNAKYDFFDDKNVDRVIRLTCEGFKSLSSDIYIHIGYSFYQFFCIVGSILFPTYSSPVGFILVGLSGLVCYLLHRVYYAIWRHLKPKDTAAQRELQTQFIDTATGSAHIRALGWEMKHTLQSRRCVNRCEQTSARIDSLERWSLFVHDLLGVSLLGLFAFAALHCNLPPFQVGMGLFTILAVPPELEYMVLSWNGLRNNLGIFSEMEEFIKTTPQEQPDATKALPKGSQVQGEIKLKDVSFGYRQNRPPRLQHINMVIPRGARFGVYGDSQSGKTALLLALRGLLPYTGSITLDGREIRDIPRNHLIDIFAMLPEKPVVFPGATILQTLFPSEILRPGRAESCQNTMSTILYRLGLLDMINEAGGYKGKFEDLYLTTDQVHLFSLARLIGEHLLGKGSVFLIDGVTGRVALDTHTRMRTVIRDFLEIGERTMIYTFGNDTLVLHSTHLSQIVATNIVPVNLGGTETV